MALWLLAFELFGALHAADWPTYRHDISRSVVVQRILRFSSSDVTFFAIWAYIILDRRITMQSKCGQSRWKEGSSLERLHLQEPIGMGCSLDIMCSWPLLASCKTAKMM